MIAIRATFPRPRSRSGRRGAGGGAAADDGAGDGAGQRRMAGLAGESEPAAGERRRKGKPRRRRAGQRVGVGAEEGGIAPPGGRDGSRREGAGGAGAKEAGEFGAGEILGGFHPCPGECPGRPAADEADDMVAPARPGVEGHERLAACVQPALDEASGREIEPLGPLGAQRDLAQKPHRESGDGRRRCHGKGGRERDVPGGENPGRDGDDGGFRGHRPARGFERDTPSAPVDARDRGCRGQNPGRRREQAEDIGAEPLGRQQIRPLQPVGPPIGEAEAGGIGGGDQGRLDRLAIGVPGVGRQVVEGGGEARIGAGAPGARDQRRFQRRIGGIAGGEFGLRRRSAGDDHEALAGAGGIDQRLAAPAAEAGERVALGAVQPGRAVIEGHPAEGGGMVGEGAAAGARQGFEEDHPGAAPREKRRRREPRDAGADDGDLGRVHPMARARRRCAAASVFSRR